MSSPYILLAWDVIVYPYSYGSNNYARINSCFKKVLYFCGPYTYHLHLASVFQLVRLSVGPSGEILLKFSTNLKIGFVNAICPDHLFSAVILVFQVSLSPKPRFPNKMNMKNRFCG